jgi:hypothetical protein
MPGYMRKVSIQFDKRCRATAVGRMKHCPHDEFHFTDFFTPMSFLNARALDKGKDRLTSLKFSVSRRLCQKLGSTLLTKLGALCPLGP